MTETSGRAIMAKYDDRPKAEIPPERAEEFECVAYALAFLLTALHMQEIQTVKKALAEGLLG